MKRTERGGKAAPNGYKILSIILAAVLAATVIVEFVLWQKEYIVFQNPNARTEKTIQGGLLLGESSGNGLAVKSAKLSLAEYAENGVSAQAESAYTLTATVSPDNTAENTGVTWTVAWSDANSAWASGKTVQDYVTVTPSGEDYLSSKKAVVACLQAFAEPIVIKAAALDNLEKYAVCTADYAQKINFVSLKFGTMDIILGGETSVVWEVNEQGTGVGGDVTVDISKSSIYTVEDAFTYTVTLDKDNWDLTWQFGGQQVPVSVNIMETDITDGSMVFNRDMLAAYYMSYTFMGNKYLKDEAAGNLYTYFNSIKKGKDKIFGVTVKVTGRYSSYSERSQLVSTGATNTSVVSDVALNKDEIVF